MLHFLPEIESDMSVFHRVEDIYVMESALLFRRAVCLPAYDGALAARKSQQLDQQRPRIQDVSEDEEAAALARHRQKVYAEFLEPGETPQSASIAECMQTVSEMTWG